VIYQLPNLVSRRVLQLTITYELLSHIFERSSSIVSLFKELENIRIDAWFISR
jgi:hypothetical protein